MNVETYKTLRNHRRELRIQETRFRRLGELCAKSGQSDEAEAALERARSLAREHLAVSAALSEVAVPEAAMQVERAGRVVDTRAGVACEARA